MTEYLQGGHLYKLMPTVYRQRDVARGYPLLALFNALQEQYDVVEGDIGQLYDSWFIETAPEALIGYLADLVAVGGADLLQQIGGDTRRFVANALRYRRRKGTLETLASAASDVLGWCARADDLSALVSQTQHLADVRANDWTTIDVSDIGGLNALDSSQDRAGRTFDVTDRYDLRHVALYIWRIGSYPVQDAQAYGSDGRRFWFHPLGVDTPLLFPVYDLEQDTPDVVQRDVLRLMLSQASGGPLPAGLPFAIELPDGTTLQADDVIVCDLSHWIAPGLAQAKIAVDPERGRFMTADPVSGAVTVSYAYGMPGEIGGGPYPREQSDYGTAGVWRAYVTVEHPPAYAPDIPSSRIFVCVDDALAAMDPSATVAVIDIMDSASYRASSGVYCIAAGREQPVTVVLRAGSGTRPALLGDVDVDARESYVKLVLDGVTIDGTVTMRGGGRCEVRDATILAAPALSIQNDGVAPSSVALERSIVSAIHVEGFGISLHANQAVVDGRGASAIETATGSDCYATLSNATLIGAVSVTELRAQESIFTGDLRRARPDVGYVRNCIDGNAWLASTVYGALEYARLRDDAPPSLSEGASDGMQLGAYHQLGLSARKRVLDLALAEFLPYGYAVDVRYVT